MAGAEAGAALALSALGAGGLELAEVQAALERVIPFRKPEQGLR